LTTGEYSKICEGTLQEAEELASIAEQEIFIKSKNLGKRPSFKKVKL
jgi:hypothetical protein